MCKLSPQTGSGDKHERQQQQGAEKQQNGRYLMPALACPADGFPFLRLLASVLAEVGRDLVVVFLCAMDKPLDYVMCPLLRAGIPVSIGRAGGGRLLRPVLVNHGVERADGIRQAAQALDQPSLTAFSPSSTLPTSVASSSVFMHSSVNRRGEM